MSQLLPVDHALVVELDPFLRSAAGKEDAQADPAAVAEDAALGAQGIAEEAKGRAVSRPSR